jgi:hypothetical protein
MVALDLSMVERTPLAKHQLKFEIHTISGFRARTPAPVKVIIDIYKMTNLIIKFDRGIRPDLGFLYRGRKDTVLKLPHELVSLFS